MPQDYEIVKNRESQLTELEIKLLRAIVYGSQIQKSNWKSIRRAFADFFSLLPDVYPKKIMRRNYFRIAKLIKKNRWNSEKWNNKDIHSEDFKKICRTPIYLPALGKELLSGEYVIFLLLGKHLQLEYDIPFDDPRMTYTEDEYQKEYARNKDKRKHERFFGSKNTKTKTYLKQFSDHLSITFENDSSMVETATGHLKRKATDTYRMFDEYGYAAYDINKNAGESIDILGIFDTPYVYNIDSYEIMGDIFLPVRCDGLLLFKTALFQHLDRVQRRPIMAFASQIQELVKLIPNVVSNWRRYVSLLSGRRKQSTLGTATKYKNLMEDAKHWIENGIESMRKELESCCDLVCVNQHRKIYPTVMWRVLVVEAVAASKISRSSINANVEMTKETEKLHAFITLQPSSLQDIKKMQGITRWEDFYRIYGDCLMEYFDDQDENRLKKDWLLAIKTILYCNYDSLKKRIGVAIPKELDDVWLHQQNIPIQILPITGIFNVMQFIRNSSKQKVRIKEMSVRLLNGKLAKRKIFLELLSTDSNENATDMRQILESLTSEKFMPALARQIQEILREYKIAMRANQDVLHASREILFSLWDIFDQFIRNVSTFEDSERNMCMILKKLDALNNQITVCRMNLDFSSH